MSHAVPVPAPPPDPRTELEAILTAKGWSLERASRRLQTNKAKLFRVLRGQDPDIKLALEIEEKLGIPVRRWLLVVIFFVTAHGADALDFLDMIAGRTC